MQFSVPFAAGRLGASIYFGINITTQRSYRFSLDFEADPSAPFPFANAAPSANGGPETDRTAPMITHFPVQLRVVRVESNDVVTIVNRAYSDEVQESAANGHVSLTVTSLDLRPGDYRVRVEALGSLAAIDAVPITFDVGPT